jgi:N-acetyl-gamma-glutamylphosphate reductase
MKLIIVGATGFVGNELIRQSLRRNDITSVIAVSRRPLPSSLNEIGVTKLRSVVIKDYDEYSDEARREFSGANACIWYAAFLSMGHWPAREHR